MNLEEEEEEEEEEERVCMSLLLLPCFQTHAPQTYCEEPSVPTHTGAGTHHHHTAPELSSTLHQECQMHPPVELPLV